MDGRDNSIIHTVVTFNTLHELNGVNRNHFLFRKGYDMKLKLNCAVYAILFLTAMAQTGCATFLNDDNQMVAFNTTPDGARVAIDGIAMGDTPIVLPVPRKGGDKLITFTKSGYKTVNYELKNTLNMALAGNIILGGGIGLIVDAISGRGGGYQKTSV